MSAKEASPPGKRHVWEGRLREQQRIGEGGAVSAAREGCVYVCSQTTS